MSEILAGAAQAVVLIVRGDAEVWGVTAVSLQVSTAALALGVMTGVPIGYAIAWARGWRRHFSAWLVNSLTALPTVAIGLTLYFILSASGPLGWTELLYTRVAMVLGQWVLAIPILASLTLAALGQLPAEARETTLTLGLGRMRRGLVLLVEARTALITAMVVTFARVFTELGAAVILGGNIRGHTRTLTTVIALEHSKGDDARAMAFGIILMVIALGLNAAVYATAASRPGPRQP